MMNQEEIRDRLVVMRAQEDGTYACPDYLRLQQQLPPQPQPNANTDAEGSQKSSPIDKVCRDKMAQWCFTVIDYINFQRETVSIAMSYLDRFLASDCCRAKKVLLCRREYQLAAMTTLFMAIKINEPVMIDVALLTDLSKGLYTPSDFQSMETDILFGLNWHVNGPTPQAFLLHFLSLLQTSASHFDDHSVAPAIDLHHIMQLATHQIELSTQEYQFMTQKPSVIATASILNSLNGSNYKMASQSFTKSLLQLTSSLGISIQQVLSAKELLLKCKTNSTMKLRLTTTTIMKVQMSQPQQSAKPQMQSQSPRSAAVLGSQSPSQSILPSSNKSLTQSCSPICVSKRNIMLQQQQQ